MTRPAHELSQRQVLATTRLAVLPIGSFEVHNRDLPLGTDTFIAQAVAQLVCEKAGGLLLPPLIYTYAGVTATMEGTISVDMPAMAAYLTATFSAIRDAGLGPLVVTSAHGGNDIPCTAAIEQVFHGQPAGLLYCNVLSYAYSDLMTEVWGVPDVALAENCALWAAWKLQDRPEQDRPTTPAEQEGKPKRLRRIAKAGHVAHTYDRPDQHIVIREEATLTQGHIFLTKAADRIVSVLRDLRTYHNELTHR